MQTIIDQIWPLFQVILVDLVLAGDNAIVVALAAAGVPAAARQRVIVIGIAGAAITRILFALITVKLLQFPGLLLVGGLLLLWVCWNLWQDLKASESRVDDQNVNARDQVGAPGNNPDHHSGCVDVTGQCAGSRRRGSR